MTTHLDLGCGAKPRNPYQRDELFGIDLSGDEGAGPVRRANLAMQPIPFDSNSFDSVSAYDFFEHMPRVLPTADGHSTRFPFIELMNEIWRVLKPGGLLYASTPVYPHKAAFQDPTHVNIISVDTHLYFVQPQKMATMYGFTGEFIARRVQLGRPGSDTLYLPRPDGLWQKVYAAHQIRRGRCSHVVWEFEAVK